MSIFNSPGLTQKRYGDVAPEAKSELLKMSHDPTYDTRSYDSGTERVSFVEHHMKYLERNKHVNPVGYLSNLKLMTRIKKR